MKGSSNKVRCWCGDQNLVEFAPGYMRCTTCESLVSRELRKRRSIRIHDDSNDFYGKEYWFTHQEKDLGFANISSRARTDLTDRCAHWLRTVLKYKLPPGKCLELGSSHGGFVALLGWAGFEASGLELSPWVVRFSRKAFGVQVLKGPVEDQSIDRASLDIITMMDVLEHIPDPVGTVQHCLSLLKPDGILIIQTPRYKERTLYGTYLSEHNRFLELLLPKEHLFLFSQESLKMFFDRLGVSHIAFEEAYFSHYDMFLVASRKPISQALPENIEKALTCTPSGRLVQAYLDFDAKTREFATQYSRAYADSQARLDAIQKLEENLAESEKDRAARLGAIEAQGKEIARLYENLHRWESENKALLNSLAELKTRYDQLKSENQSRSSVVQKLEQTLAESERDRAARLGAIEAQGKEIARLYENLNRWESENKALLGEIGALRDKAKVEADNFEKERQSLLNSTAELQARYYQLKSENQERASLMSEQERRLEELKVERNILESELKGLREDLRQLIKVQKDYESEKLKIQGEMAIVQRNAEATQLERDQLRNDNNKKSNELRVLQTQNEKLVASTAEMESRISEFSLTLDQSEKTLEGERARSRELDLSQGRLKAEITYLTKRWELVRHTLRRVRFSKVYQLMRKLGAWVWLARLLEEFLGPEERRIPTMSGQSSIDKEKHRIRVVVDLVPLLPGGENGGAKQAAIGVILNLSRIAPENELILLTTEKNHEELSKLESPNVRRFCVSANGARLDRRSLSHLTFGSSLRKWVTRILPESVIVQLAASHKKILTLLPHRTKRSSLLRKLGADLLFCPFGAPFFYDPTVPLVSVIYDLQYLYYPQFFSAQERWEREKSFRTACRLSSKIVCASDYIRSTLIENGRLDPERVVTIPIRLYDRFETVKQSNNEVLDRLGVKARGFLFYPANYWPHKNHEMLLTAFGMYRSSHPQSSLRLVLTGSESRRREYLKEAVAAMNLRDWIVFAGFLSDDEFSTLMHECFALIFPSLYEGFGMPVVEAMACGRPVLCSRIPTLEEVASEAALFFDPRKPQDIADAICRLEDDGHLLTELVDRGKRILTSIGNSELMATEYLRVFRDVLRLTHYVDGVHGISSDGWISQEVTIMYQSAPGPRILELSLRIPDAFPNESVRIEVRDDLGQQDRRVISKGSVNHLCLPARREGGFLMLTFEPTFQPKALGINEDERMLACRCVRCVLISSSGERNLLEGHLT